MKPPALPEPSDKAATDPAPPKGNGLWAIMTLIVICTAVEAVLSLSDAGLLPGSRLRLAVYEYAGFWPGLLGTWTPNYPFQTYAMFLTYAFLHSGPVHLIFNMITLFSLGQVVVARVGNSGFLLLYVLAVVGGGLGFGLLAETTRPMVGASGGLFGLAGGILAWTYVDLYSSAQRLWPVLRGVLLLLLLNLVMWWLMNGLLAWQTHLGGFLCGWVAALLIDPRGKAES